VVAVFVRTTARRALEPIRARDWWDHKLAPMLGTGYMTAFHLHASLLGLLPSFGAILVAVTAAAAYVSLVNDLADIDEDAAAGKPNRLADRTAAYVVGALAVAMTVGVAVATLAWRDDPVALALYAGPWLAFSAYSLPPIRLKAHGLAGVLADASGAAFFPHLLIVVVVFQATGRKLEPEWLAAVGVFALANGLRGILWHQLGDIEADTRSRIRTYGSRLPERARFLGQAAFVIEIAALVFLLWRSGSPLAFVLLIGYALLERARMRLAGMRLVVVYPARAPSRIALYDYYVCFYPAAFIVASAIRHGHDAVVLVLHAAAFPIALRITAVDALYAIKKVADGLRPAAAPVDGPRS
jgi:4-hydroxybenzoate polyprenyltransferase